MVAWWWGGMIMGGVLTENPPSSQRLITLAVPTVFFIAYVAWDTIRLVEKLAFSVKFTPLVLGAVVVLFSATSLTTYFKDYTPMRIYGGSNAEFATEIAPLLNSYKSDHKFRFIGAPAMYWEFATLPYLVQDADASDVTEPLQRPLPAEILDATDKGTVFIVHPTRAAELTLLREAFPGGNLIEVWSRTGRPLGVLYEIPPGPESTNN